MTAAVSDDRSVRVLLVAGEASGDELGAGLIRELHKRLGERVQCMGVCGPAMRAAGCEPWFDSRELAVMGLVEVLSHLPRLLRLRRRLVARARRARPDVFVGIDAPDFNLGVEKRLRKTGIRTIHYVSPSVWAWRPRRAARMAHIADKVLCLLPFEPAFYERYDVDAEFVGHPLADRIATRTAVAPARAELGLDAGRPTLAVLPGSRHSELRRLGPVFAQAMGLLAARHAGLQFVAPMADDSLRSHFARLLDEHAPGVGVTLTRGQAQQAIAAADAVLVASGTATLEALLLKRPMVVAYRVAPATRFLLEKLKLLQIDRFALPNLLSDEPLVPELLQDDLSPEAVAAEIGRQLERGRDDPQWLAACDRIHETLRRDASARAADALLGVVA